MRKKIIVPVILLLLLAEIMLIGLGSRPQSFPDLASAPSVLTGPSSSATSTATAAITAQPTESPTPFVTIQQTKPPVTPIHYTVDKSKPVKAWKNNKLKLTGKKAVIHTSGGSFCILQKDGTVDRYDHKKGEIRDIYQAKNWLYYTVEAYDTFETTIYRAPIRQHGKRTTLLLKKEERLKKLESIEWVNIFIYATNQYVIYTTDDNIIKLTAKSKKSERIDPAPDKTLDIIWYPVYGANQEQIIAKNRDFYVTKQSFKIEDDDICSTTFYKVNADTFQKTKLSDRTNAVLSDPSGQIVIMESDKRWNYAYYPETGKRIRCGQNMMREWGPDVDLNDFDFDEDTETMLYLQSAANRDLVGWIQEKDPWGYQEKDGYFSCLNYFIYNDRMYVKVHFNWKDPQEAAEAAQEEADDDEDDGYCGENAYMLFSYSLKKYKGIRPETELNRIMQKYSSRTYEGDEDTIYYSYEVTGYFSFLFNDILVFEYDDFYVLYHLGTGAHLKINEENKDLPYLEEL